MVAWSVDWKEKRNFWQQISPKERRSGDATATMWVDVMAASLVDWMDGATDGQLVGVMARGMVVPLADLLVDLRAESMAAS